MVHQSRPALADRLREVVEAEAHCWKVTEVPGAHQRKAVVVVVEVLLKVDLEQAVQWMAEAEG